MNPKTFNLFIVSYLLLFPIFYAVTDGIALTMIFSWFMSMVVLTIVKG